MNIARLPDLWVLVLMVINYLLMAGAYLMIRGAWLKVGVGYVLDNQRGTSHGASDLFVAWALNILLWICTAAFWYSIWANYGPEVFGITWGPVGNPLYHQYHQPY